jgi:hypothetical protein
MDSAIKTAKIIQFIGDKFEAGEIDNESLLAIIEDCGQYLNLMTIPHYATKNKISYNGAKNHRNVVSLFGCKFVVDND